MWEQTREIVLKQTQYHQMTAWVQEVKEGRILDMYNLLKLISLCCFPSSQGGGQYGGVGVPKFYLGHVEFWARIQGDWGD